MSNRSWQDVSGATNLYHWEVLGKQMRWKRQMQQTGVLRFYFSFTHNLMVKTSNVIESNRCLRVYDFVFEQNSNLRFCGDSTEGVELSPKPLLAYPSILTAGEGVMGEGGVHRMVLRLQSKPEEVHVSALVVGIRFTVLHPYSAWTQQIHTLPTPQLQVKITAGCEATIVEKEEYWPNPDDLSISRKKTKVREVDSGKTLTIDCNTLFLYELGYVPDHPLSRNDGATHSNNTE